jgi:glyoxylase-like metal-dependent hydrolase (beta-lactamase superfamily II)
MEIKKFITDTYQMNVYVCYDNDTKAAVVIDPGGKATDTVDFVRENGLSVKYILLTHGHFDHIMAVQELMKCLDVPVAAAEAERELLADPSQNFAKLVRGEDYRVQVDVPLKDGDKISLEGITFTVLHTPGHTNGCVCFYNKAEGVLFSGDTLFYETVGRTDLPGGNYGALVTSITDKLYTLPPDTMVYPGHSRMTTIEHERVHNPFISA